MDPALNLLNLVMRHWILFVFFKYQWVKWVMSSRNSFETGFVQTWGHLVLYCCRWGPEQKMALIIRQILDAHLYSQTSHLAFILFLRHCDKCCLFVGSRSLVDHLQALKRFVSSSICLSAGQMEACWGSRGEEALSFDLREFVWTRCTDSCPDRNMALNIPTLWAVVLPVLWTWFQQFKVHLTNTAF